MNTPLSSHFTVLILILHYGKTSKILFGLKSLVPSSVVWLRFPVWTDGLDIVIAEIMISGDVGVVLRTYLSPLRGLAIQVGYM